LIWTISKSKKHQLFLAHPNQSHPSLEALDLWEKLYLCMSRALRLMSQHAAQKPASRQIRGFGRGRGFGGYPLQQPQAPGDDWGEGWPFFYSLSRSGVGG